MRPRPHVLRSFEDRSNHRTTEILKADALYAIFYKGEPVGIRQVSHYVNMTPKYRRVSSPNPAFLFNTCQALNEKLNCLDFTVVRIDASGVRPVTRDEVCSTPYKGS